MAGAMGRQLRWVDVEDVLEVMGHGTKDLCEGGSGVISSGSWCGEVAVQGSGSICDVFHKYGGSAGT